MISFSFGFILIILAAPFIIFGATFWWAIASAIIINAYYATQHTVFMIRVLRDVRGQPINYPYLNKLYSYPYLLLGSWWSALIHGIETKGVETKADKTRYIFRGWKYPEIERGTSEPCTEPDF